MLLTVKFYHGKKGLKMSSHTLKEAFYQFQVHCSFVLDEHLFQKFKEKLFNVCA